MVTIHGFCVSHGLQRHSPRATGAFSPPVPRNIVIPSPRRGRLKVAPGAGATPSPGFIVRHGPEPPAGAIERSICGLVLISRWERRSSVEVLLFALVFKRPLRGLGVLWGIRFPGLSETPAPGATVKRPLRGLGITSRLTARRITPVNGCLKCRVAAPGCLWISCMFYRLADLRRTSNPEAAEGGYPTWKKHKNPVPFARRNGTGVMGCLGSF